MAELNSNVKNFRLSSRRERDLKKHILNIHFEDNIIEGSLVKAQCDQCDFIADSVASLETHKH